MPAYKPEDTHTLTPFFTLQDASSFIQFLDRVFGAHTEVAMRMPDGHIGHAVSQIGDSKAFLMDGESNMPLANYVYVEDCDGTYRKALAEGAQSEEAPTDQFWGDRQCTVRDRWGNVWWIATHVEDVSDEEMERRMSAMAPR